MQDKEDKEDNKGVGFVAGTYIIVMGALFVGGAIVTKLEKNKIKQLSR